VVREGSYTSYWDKTVFMRLHLQPLRDSSGHISGVLGIVEDITERRQVEEALCENEKKYHMLVENSRDIIYQMDLQGVLTFISGNVEKLTGYRADEVIGKRIWDFLAPHCRDLVLGSRDQRIRDEDIPPYEIQLRCKDGGFKPFELLTATIADGEGKIVGSQGVARDITERKQTEEELSIYKYIRQNAPEAIGLIGADGSIVEANINCCRLLGYTRTEMLSKTVFDIMPDSDRAAWPSWLKKVREEGSIRQVATCRMKDGEQIMVDFSVGYFNFGGKESICLFGRKID
jgi:PAS domain S-box-containing protein